MAERDRRRSGGLSGRTFRSAFVLSLIGGLAACETGDEAAGDYPSLHSVPREARASTSVDARRGIVRDLIEERDRSRRQTAVVRARSGFGVERLPDPFDDDVKPEDVVRDAPGGDGEGFRLTPGEGDDADSVYRGEPQFEDGSLDDFIRKLKRETSPAVPADADEPASEPVSDVPSGKDVNARGPDPTQASPILHAAFLPVLGEGPSRASDVMIRLAAAGDEPGFFCSYLGWTVAWSSMCVAEAGTEPVPEGDDGVGADLGEDDRLVEEEATPESRRSARSGSSTPDETGEERAERRLTEEDAAEAIENAGRSALAPVTGSLEKLRNFIEARRTGAATAPRRERSPALRRSDPAMATIDRPPLPRPRPDRRLDVSIVDRGERFDFIRTPTPHLRPVRDEPVILEPAPDEPVILPPESGSAAGTPPRPRFKPTIDEPPLGILPSAGRHLDEPVETPPPTLPQEPPAAPDDPEGDRVAEPKVPTLDDVRAAQKRLAAAVDALTDGVADVEAADKVAEPPSPAPSALQPEQKAPAAVPPSPSESAEPPPPSVAAIEPAAPPAASPAEPPSTELEPVIIRFEPETPGLPEGTGPRLAALLTHARATDRQIYIIGEASTNHLARRRATDVGAALVQLGATVEILEYDHQARTGVDQVRLVLKSEEADPLFSTTAPTAIQR